MGEIEKEIKSEEKKIKKNKWMFISVIFIILTIVFAGLYLTKDSGLSTGYAANKAINWIKSYYSANGIAVNINLVNASEVNGVYKFIVNMSSSQGAGLAEYYVSKDGNIFFPQGIPTTPLISSSALQTETEIPKTEKPTVDLYVMSFCPYGVQAEKIMKPVYDLLKNKADFKIRFIANVGGDTVDSVQSLHGNNEAKEDLRQLCINKYYPDSYWNYVFNFDNTCYSLANNANALDDCWKNESLKLGINVSKIESCAYSSEGLNLLKADEELTDKYGVTGSPTLIINGVDYSGARTSEAYKQAICSAFKTAPAECNQSLSTTGTAASGNC